MELTKQEKHELYKQCLIDIEKKLSSCCCFSFWKNISDEFKNENKLNDSSFIDVAHKLFPELYKLKLKSKSIFWFESREKRIAALKKCIEQTK